MNFAAFGRTRILYDSIKALVTAGHSPRIVGTCRASPESEIKEADFARLAYELGVEFFDSTAINSDRIVNTLALARADVAISVNWLTVVRERVCSLFPNGVLNCHAGDLPRYRGNAPYAYAILQNEPCMGLCIHRMEPGVLDSGPIVVRRQVPITPSTYVGDLIADCERLVPEMFCEALRGLENGDLTPEPQPADPALALRCYPRKPEDGLIDWSLPADAICRLIRASSAPFAGACTFFEGEQVTIWRAHAEASPCPYLGVPGQVVERRASGEILVLTPQGFVAVECITDVNGRSVVPADMVKSLRQRFGLNPVALCQDLLSRVLQLEQVQSSHSSPQCHAMMKESDVFTGYLESPCWELLYRF